MWFVFILVAFIVVFNPALVTSAADTFPRWNASSIPAFDAWNSEGDAGIGDAPIVARRTFGVVLLVFVVERVWFFPFSFPFFYLGYRGVRHPFANFVSAECHRPAVSK